MSIFTLMAQRFVQQHLPKLGDDRTLSRIPVVVIQAPPVPEERRFYQAILDQVFAPFRPSSSIEDLQHETLPRFSKHTDDCAIARRAR